MTKEELFQILSDNTQDVTVDGGSESHLILSGSLLSSSAITEVLSTHLGEDEIRIRLNSPITQANLTASGNLLNEKFQDLSCSALFDLDAGTPTCLLEISPDSLWRLSSTYADLEGSFFDQVAFASDSLIKLASLDGSISGKTAQKGLHLAASLPGSDFFEPILWLLGNQNLLKLDGEISLSNEQPTFILSSSVSIPVELGFFRLPFVKLSLISDADGDALKTHICVETELDFFNGTDSVKLPLKALFQNPNFSFLLFLDVNDLLDAAFDALSSLVNDMNVQDLIPAGFEIGDLIQMENVVLQVLPKEKKLNSVSLAIQSAQPWEIVSNLLTLETISLGIELNDPLGNAELSMALMGEMSIDNTL